MQKVSAKKDTKNFGQLSQILKDEKAMKNRSLISFVDR